jgi:hypothetical protein
MKAPSIEKVGFVLSLMILSLLYGWAARWHGWVPDRFLERAQRQVDKMLYNPSLADRVYEREGVQVKQPEAVQPGLTLITSYWPYADEWETGLRLIDEQGTVLHDWRIDRETLFPDSIDRRGDPTAKNLHGAHLFPNGDVLVNVDYVGTARLDACGRVEWRLPRGTHHSIHRAADGTFWIPGTSQRPRTNTERYPEGFSGLDDPVWLDQLLHVSASGEVLEKINVLDVLYANDLQRYIVKAYQPQAGTDEPRTRDITHLNDIEPLPPGLAEEYPLFEAGDLVVSLRGISLVFVLDPDSKVVKWHASDPFIRQHDPDFTGEGGIGVFDNRENFSKRGTMLGGSRIVSIRPHADSMTVSFPTSRSAPLYTDALGQWQQLANGNMLLVESKAGRVVEVAPSGETVWEWVMRPYDSSKVSRVPGATRYDLTRNEVRTWPCSHVDSTQKLNQLTL